MAPLFNLIKDINPSKLQWSLKLRLVRFYNVPAYGDNSNIYSLECVFHDKEGSRIHATIKRQQIEKFQHILTENHLYAVKNFIVVDNMMKYQTTTAKYKIIFVGKTLLTEFFDDDFPCMIYNFKPFDSFTDVDSIDESILIDVIGRMTAKNSPQHKQIAGRQTKMIDIVLENIQGITLACTLWGEYVDTLMNHLSTVGDNPIIILLQMCRVKKYRGEIRVSNTYYVTKVMINSEVAEIIDYRSRFITEGNTISSVSNISFPTSAIADDLESSKDLFRTIEQIEEIGEVGSFWVFGKIVAIESSTDWWYISCTKCPRKMTPAVEQFYCEKCDSWDSVGNIRYKIQVCVIDHTGNAVFLIWDRDCMELIGKSAFELKENNNDVLPREIENLVDLKVLFKIQIKAVQSGNYNRTYTVIKLTVDNGLVDRYCSLFFESQESDIFSKLKESEIGDDNELCSSEDEVTTPQKNTKKTSIYEDITEDPNLKRKLIDEFSSSAKDKKIKVDIKKEKE